MADDKRMIKLWALYLGMSTVFAVAFGYVAVNYGGPVFAAGFLPPTIFGIAVAGRAFQLGQEVEREKSGRSGNI